MKFNLNKGTVTLISETESEALELFRLAVKTTDVFAPQLKKHKPHKKHEFLKRCDVCGKGFKGNKSIALHKSKAHGIKGANYEVNHRYSMKRKARLEAERAALEMKEIWK